MIFSPKYKDINLNSSHFAAFIQYCLHVYKVCVPLADDPITPNVQMAITFCISVAFYLDFIKGDFHLM